MLVTLCRQASIRRWGVVTGALSLAAWIGMGAATTVLQATQLLRVPSMVRSNEQTECRYLLVMGDQQDKGSTAAQLNYWVSLGPTNTITAHIMNDQTNVGFYSRVMQFSSPWVTHWFGLGYHLTHYAPISIPFSSYFLGYSGEFDQFSRLHMAIGHDEAKHRLLALAAIDLDLGEGNVSVEWDGVSVIVGYRHRLTPSMVVQGYVTPVGESPTARMVPKLMLGVSLSDPWRTEPKVPTVTGLIVSSGASRPPMASNTPVEYGLDDALRRLTQANDYFYAGNYELARSEMEYLLTIFPTAGSYSRLGSIYFKLNQLDKALENWKTAFSLDKSNAALESFINQLESQKQLESKKMVTPTTTP